MMKMKKTRGSLTTFGIAYKNLIGKPGRSVALVVVVSVMAFALFGGAILSQSLDNGIRSLEARLGADIAIVPQGNEADYESVILTGAVPVNLHFDSDIARQLSKVPGVSQVTVQFYLATLGEADCCSTITQIIGIDYYTDFVIQAWIAELLHRQIGDGEVIVGSNVIADQNNAVRFFDTPLAVAARLERTATGMDNTVFVNMTTARELAAISQSGGFAFEGVDVKNAISTVLVNIDPAYDVSAVADYIRTNIPNAGVVTSYGIYTSIATNLRFFTGIINAITISATVLAVIILALLFSLISGGRKKEFAVLRILGATRKKLASIVLMESIYISLCGAIFGIVLAAIVVFPFGRQIGLQMGMPLLLPPHWDSARLFVITLALSALVGSLASAYSAYKISRAETYATMREGE